MIRHKFITGVIALAFLLPVTTAAQTVSEDEYRAYLLALIELLQEQVALLIAEEADINNPIAATNHNRQSFESFLIGDVDEVDARYIINSPRDVERLEDPVHRSYFSRFFEIVPDAYDDYFVDLLVFSEEGNQFDGFVETVPPYRQDTWRIGINEDIFSFGSGSDAVAELYVHEFAHILSYEDMPNSIAVDSSSCHELFEELGCPPANSYLLDFIDTFWADRELDELVETGDINDVFTNRELRTQFVSRYASTHPAEDFAESFAYFVLEEEVTGNSPAADKVNYFYNFPVIVSLRSEILEAL